MEKTANAELCARLLEQAEDKMDFAQADPDEGNIFWQDVRVLQEAAARLGRLDDRALHDRLRWGGCKYCLTTRDGYSLPFDTGGRAVTMYIPEGESALYIRFGNARSPQVIPIDYCPMCGRPLNEYALTVQEQRIHGYCSPMKKRCAPAAATADAPNLNRGTREGTSSISQMEENCK